MNQCQNCSTNFDSKFCPNCGQKIVHRLTLHDVWHDIVHVVIHADKGIFGFAKDMVLRPGLVARDYLSGARKKYFNPLQYLLILTGVMVFLMKLSHFQEKIMKATQAMQQANGAAPPSAAVQQMMGKWMNVIQNNQTFLYFLMIPFFALGLGWFYKKAKLNFAERVVLVVMGNNCAYTLMLLTFYPILFFLPDNMISIGMSVSFLLHIFGMVLTNHQFFKGNFWENFIRSLLIFIIGYVFFFLMMMIIGFVGVFVYMKFFR
jgi:RNA polymerase subunit RPABC4/transcription elongation factor Spt4